MAQTAALMIYLFFTIFSLSLLPWTSTSFTLKLTHRDSPLSPLYQSNLSDSERFMKNIKISKARASYLHQQQNELTGALSIRLPLKLHEPLFTVEIGIGTPAVKRTLIFDTGSDLTWTQCTPCINCFKQNEPLFDPKRSSSYKAITKIHPLAKSFECTSSGCSYRMGYHSGQSTAGVAAAETFTFDSNATVSNLAFGCATNSIGNYPSQISGILGLDRGPISFARQLGSPIKARFSYCMSPITSNTSKGSYSYVRFGDEAVIRGRNAQRTPFSNNSPRGTYVLSLIDLSINGQKLGLGQAAFRDGCSIDSGSSISLLNTRAFSAVRDWMDKYFAKLNFRRFAGNQVPKGAVCYTKEAANISSFPNLTFNLKGADFYVPVTNLFRYMEGNVFCLAMMESKDVTILGAFQQRNVRIVYDLKGMMLSFAPEDCSKDAST